WFCRSGVVGSRGLLSWLGRSYRLSRSLFCRLFLAEFLGGQNVVAQGLGGEYETVNLLVGVSDSVVLNVFSVNLYKVAVLVDFVRNQGGVVGNDDQFASSGEVSVVV